MFYKTFLILGDETMEYGKLFQSATACLKKKRNTKSLWESEVVGKWEDNYDVVINTFKVGS